MASPVSAYAFINAKLRSRMSKLVSGETLDQMIQSKSLEEAVQLLGATSFASVINVYQETGDLLMTELEIERLHRISLRDVLRYVQQLSDEPVAAFVAAVLVRFEIATVKNALRLWFERVERGRSVDDKVSYILRDGATDVDALINAPDAEAVVAVVSKQPFAPVLADAFQKFAESHSLFPIEIALDRWYYHNLAGSATALNRRDKVIAERLIGIEIDMINVNWIVRIRTFRPQGESGSVPMPDLLPGGTTADIQSLDAAMHSPRPAEDLAKAFEKRIGSSVNAPEKPGDQTDSSIRTLALLESLLQQMMRLESKRALGGFPFTVGVILAYFAMCRQEIRSITTVLNGKYYDLSANRIEALI